MRKPESSLATIRENEKPSTLISLQLTNRLVSDLSGIEKYKSLVCFI